MSRHTRASKAQKRRDEERRQAKIDARNATHYSANGVPFVGEYGFRIACQVRNCDQYINQAEPIPLCPSHSVQIWSQVQQRLNRSDIIEAAADLQAMRALNQKNLDLRKARDTNPTRLQMKQAEAVVNSLHPLSELTDEELDAAIEEEKQYEQDIYYIRQGDLIKIGYSSNLESRLFSYGPTITVLAHHFGTREDERDLHRTFRPFLAHGREWYDPAKILLDHIEEMVRLHGEPHCIPKWSTPKGQATAHRKSAQAKPNGLSI